MSRVALVTDADKLFEAYGQAHALLENCDTLGNNWLSSKAAEKGFGSAKKIEIKRPWRQNTDTHAEDFGAGSDSCDDIHDLVMSQLKIAEQIGVSAASIARISDVSDSSISRFKNGLRKPSYETLQKLSSGLKLLSQQRE